MAGNISIPGPGHGNPSESTRPALLPEADPSGPLRMHRAAVHGVAHALSKDLGDLKKGGGPGTYHDLVNQRNTNIGVEAVAAEPSSQHYPGARGLHASIKNAHTAIPATYQNFIVAYQAAIVAINQSANNVNGAEDASKKSARNVAPKLPPAPVE